MERIDTRPGTPRKTPLERLRGEGRREYVRLVPTRSLPARVKLKGASGWRLGKRVVNDVSLGGLAVSLSRWEASRVRVGDIVVMELWLAGEKVTLCGRSRHMSVEDGLLRNRRLGVQFEADASMRSVAPVLGQYLLNLLDAA